MAEAAVPAPGRDMRGPAGHSFDRFPCAGGEMKAVLSLAKRIAKYPAAVLLTGEPGTGKGLMARCIHNESPRRRAAFVSLDCGAWRPETLDTMLFGACAARGDGLACMAEQAGGGTLYLSHADALPAETQYKVLRLLRGSFLHNGPNLPADSDVRVIASTDGNLAGMVERGAFRRDLFYAINVLSVELPPLRRRREDIAAWFDLYLAESRARYGRDVRLTQEAGQFLRKYDWPGNLDQMANLCERIVLLAEQRTVDEVFLKKQLRAAAPRLLPGAEPAVPLQDPRAAELAEALRKHHGSRERTAAELGVSKTTLWRYMKKYGVEADFTLAHGAP